MTKPHSFAVLLLLSGSGIALAEEPNNDFFESTILAPGVLLVADDLEGGGSGAFPDTIVGARSQFGDVYAANDDGGPWADAFGSALYGLPVEGGGISFSVSGLNDDFFIGDHFESGDFEAVVTVYDFFGDEVDMFSTNGTLVPGLTEEFSFSDFDWFNGSYDVEVNNTISGGGGDVDFFTFTGLSPGQTYSAETLDPDGFDIDTLLAEFDEFGSQIGFNDDLDEFTRRSRLEVIAPASGEVTLAVTAYDDFNFEGSHGETWTYELELTLVVGGVPGDANGDGSVDLLDLDILGANFGLTSGATVAEGDFNGDGAVDLLDLDILGANFGFASAAATPEPGSIVLATIFATTLGLSGARRRVA